MALTTASQAPQQPLQHSSKLHHQKSGDRNTVSESGHHWLRALSVLSASAKNCVCTAQPKVAPMLLLSVPTRALHTGRDYLE